MAGYSPWGHEELDVTEHGTAQPGLEGLLRSYSVLFLIFILIVNNIKYFIITLINIKYLIFNNIFIYLFSRS